MRKASTAARNTMPITVPSGTCTKTSMRIIRETGMITTAGVVTTVAGDTVGGDPNPRVLTFARSLVPEIRRDCDQAKVMRLDDRYRLAAVFASPLKLRRVCYDTSARNHHYFGVRSAILVGSCCSVCTRPSRSRNPGGRRRGQIRAKRSHAQIQ